MEQLELRSDDGTALAAYRWAPVGEVKADLLLVHGLADHMGRYPHVTATLTEAGYRVTGVELRGHGHSEGKRGHVTNWERYVDDLRAAARTIDGPHAIIAHSMGGLVTLDHLRDGPAWAAVVSAPALAASVEAPTWKLAAAGLLSRVWPGLHMDNEIPSTAICSDPAVVEAYDADPLVFGVITPRWYTEFTAAQDRVKAAAAGYRTPLYAAWGSDDMLVSTEAIVEFCADYGGEVHTREWVDLYHEILNERRGDEVLAEMIAFLDERVPA